LHAFQKHFGRVLLTLWRPGQHPIKNGFDFGLGHIANLTLLKRPRHRSYPS